MALLRRRFAPICRDKVWSAAASAGGARSSAQPSLSSPVAGAAAVAGGVSGRRLPTGSAALTAHDAMSVVRVSSGLFGAAMAQSQVLPHNTWRSCSPTHCCSRRQREPMFAVASLPQGGPSLLCDFVRSLVRQERGAKRAAAAMAKSGSFREGTAAADSSAGSAALTAAVPHGALVSFQRVAHASSRPQLCSLTVAVPASTGPCKTWQVVLCAQRPVLNIFGVAPRRHLLTVVL